MSDELGKVAVAVLVVVLGVGALLFSPRERSRLPGDLVIHHGNFVFYSPLGFSFVLSALLTIAVSLLSRK